MTETYKHTDMLRYCTSQHTERRDCDVTHSQCVTAPPSTQYPVTRYYDVTHIVVHGPRATKRQARKDEKDSGDVSSKKRGAKKAKQKEESDTSDSEDEGGVVTYIPHILAICIEPAATATYFTAASTAGISTSNAARAACYADDDAT